MNSFSLFFLGIFFCINSFSQNVINQFDSSGKKNGPWKGYHDLTKKNLKYEGVFSHGKEKGEFTFYKLKDNKSYAACKRIFNGSFSEVTFYTPKGQELSKGRMKANNRIGKWVYFYEGTDNVMLEENYDKKGLLNGKSTKYFRNGEIAETSNYSNDLLEGEQTNFNEKGKVVGVRFFNKNVLNGPAKFYYNDGVLLKEGIYKEDLKYGVWKFYEKGKVVKTEEYLKGRIVKSKN
jgi:antitoxin component YwqK of YwqJK toxin-antitoxin module